MENSGHLVCPRPGRNHSLVISTLICSDVCWQNLGIGSLYTVRLIGELVRSTGLTFNSLSLKPEGMSNWGPVVTPCPYLSLQYCHLHSPLSLEGGEVPSRWSGGPAYQNLLWPPKTDRTTQWNCGCCIPESGSQWELELKTARTVISSGNCLT